MLPERIKGIKKSLNKRGCMSAVTPGQGQDKVYQTTITPSMGGQVAGASTDSTNPPPVATQRSEVAQKQSGVGTKIGSFFRGALNVLKVGVGSVLAIVGIPVFLIAAFPAMAIGAMVKSSVSADSMGMRPGDTPKETAAGGALMGLANAAALIVVGATFAKSGIDGLKK